MKRIIFVTILLVLLLMPRSQVKATEHYMEDIDYSEIQGVIDDVLNQQDHMKFEDYVNKLMNGEEDFSFAAVGDQLIQSIKGEVKANINTFGRLISISLLAALFTSLSMAFKNNQVSETGYYVTYLILFGILISAFITASIIATDTLGAILNFMKALVPSYFISVGFVSGAGTSFVYYEAAIMTITLADFLLIKLIIPLINFYLVIMLVNNLSKEDMLSKLAGLFETAIQWTLKSLLAAVVGLHAIQGLIVPISNQVKRSALLKASEAVPGIGNALGSVTETVIGAGILLKNAIGVAGLVVILVICAVPMIKLVVITIIFKCSGAVLQPISDKRITECIVASAKSSSMLLQTIFVGAVLFLITIAIVAVTTGNSML